MVDSRIGENVDSRIGENRWRVFFLRVVVVFHSVKHDVTHRSSGFSPECNVRPTKERVVNAIVTSRLDYCNALLYVRNITGMNLKTVTRLTCVLIIACALLPVVASFSQSLDGKQFSAVIKELASDGLGVNEYQKYVDLEVSHEKKDFNGHSIVKSVAASLSAKLTEWTEAVERLRDVLERGYEDTTAKPTLPVCCTAPLKEKDIRFKQKASFILGKTT
ncbi:hypothetical protein NP493_412g01012 [Ridgeia piscesae]|uniref:Uncharacterized protein n=1 Tax=Ridgeia piscesae TaxID=27915 RepID=A0AAD9NUD8_RIDPI|nr:hypothetical protein NP493_412g01012 [Ridgeia piscesae]